MSNTRTAAAMTAESINQQIAEGMQDLARRVYEATGARVIVGTTVAVRLNDGTTGIAASCTTASKDFARQMFEDAAARVSGARVVYGPAPACDCDACKPPAENFN